MSAFRSRSHPQCMFGRLSASYCPADSPLASFRDHPRVSLNSCIQKPCLGLTYSKVRFEIFKSTLWLKHLRFTLSSGLGKKSLSILCRTQKIFSGLKASAIALGLQISLCRSQAWDFQKSVKVPSSSTWGRSPSYACNLVRLVVFSHRSQSESIPRPVGHCKIRIESLTQLWKL